MVKFSNQRVAYLEIVIFDANLLNILYMKHKKIIDRKLYLNSIRNIFSIIGVFSVLFLLISWTFTVTKIARIQPACWTFDANSWCKYITKAVAVNFINTYHKRYFKSEQNAVKGFFISRAAITWLLENEENNGVYVYPAINAEGNVYFDWRWSEHSKYFSVMEGVEGRHI